MEVVACDSVSPDYFLVVVIFVMVEKPLQFSDLASSAKNKK